MDVSHSRMVPIPPNTSHTYLTEKVNERANVFISIILKLINIFNKYQNG